MDRNRHHSLNLPSSPIVALRKESVDRNNLFVNPGSTTLTSLSARRAWIEITLRMPGNQAYSLSLSARRAWIEIRTSSGILAISLRRSPQGERG